MAEVARQQEQVTAAIGRGAIAGLAGGLVFGILMAMMGILPMVGMLIGQPNAAVGFVVHMVISAIIGAIYGLVVTLLRLPKGWATAVIGGGLYGAIWWVLGALILMPLFLGMTEKILVVGPMQWMSLVGHLVYGAIAGVVFRLLSEGDRATSE